MPAAPLPVCFLCVCVPASSHCAPAVHAWQRRLPVSRPLPPLPLRLSLHLSSRPVSLLPTPPIPLPPLTTRTHATGRQTITRARTRRTHKAIASPLLRSLPLSHLPPPPVPLPSSSAVLRHLIPPLPPLLLLFVTMPAFNLASLRSCPLGAVAYNVLLLVYIILQFIAFFFVLVATPIDMFRRKNVLPGGSFDCFTLWGYKRDCSSLHYLFTINKEFSQCPALLDGFRAAQAFAIISILVYGGAFVASFAILYGYSFIRWVCLALNIVGIATLCVVWAAMVVAYKSDDPKCSSLRDIGPRFGAGFVLFVIAWILDIINTVILLLPCTVTDSDEDKHTKRPAAEE
ncbi:uncharacterized protein [Leishmania mexicana MHOM/GT/2001/U1103]|uniref:Uncharacterized protein n=1 Tax=Leishmania mexicana (strain MHOM/GT/2001/U1103) TaxID=929439 RepID=E8NHN8_LEIMU|nr:uncharacterized protein [Leishmania mexicana MHOM/GT/2001/U1103]CBZ41013.1 unnamed protein product [Leishmania mexicana MHOM/GT/2001/U1103]